MHLSHSRCLGGAWRRISRPIGFSSLPFCSLPSWECVESNSVWWGKSAKFHFIQFCLCFRLLLFWGGLLFQFCSPGSQGEFVESDRTSGGWCQTFWKITTSSRDGWRTSATVTFVPRCAKPGTGFSVHTEFQSAREMGGRHEWGAEKGSVQIFFDFLTVSVLGFVPNGLWTTVEITAYSGQVTVMKSLSTFDQSP